MEKYVVVKMNNNVGKFDELENLKRQREVLEKSTQETIEKLQMENLMKMVVYINELYKSYNKIGMAAEGHKFMTYPYTVHDSTVTQMVVEVRECNYDDFNTLIKFGYSIGHGKAVSCYISKDEINLPIYDEDIGKTINRVIKRWSSIKKDLEDKITYFINLEKSKEIEKIDEIRSMLKNATDFEI